MRWLVGDSSSQNPPTAETLSEVINQCFYAEAVTPQSPGLLQPWVEVVSIINPKRVASWRRNRFAVGSLNL